jgi:hypothetical protein
MKVAFDDRTLVESQRLYFWLARNKAGATDSELRAKGFDIECRHRLTQRAVVLDSGKVRDGEIVWVRDYCKPNRPNPMNITDAPSHAPLSRHGLNQGPPPNPIPPCARGRALALVAAATHILTKQRQRLAWIVDLKKDVVLTKDDLHVDHLTEPSSMSPTGGWGDLLFRFRTALDNQAWGAFETTLVIVLHLPLKEYPAQSYDEVYDRSKRWAWVTFQIPWKVDLTCIPGRSPPTGKWALQPDTNYKPKSMEREGTERPGDWWEEGVPF